MLNLSTKIDLTESTWQSPNLLDRLDKEDRGRLGTYALDGYKRDDGSRSQWKIRMQNAMDLAVLLQKDRTFPWPGASNVAFPLVTIASLQFHARAYPAIISGTDIVKYRVVGEDPSGAEKARAIRIGNFMSWQCLEEDEPWEEQHDRLLIVLPVMGCAFVKSRWLGAENHAASSLVMPQDLVLDYWAPSVEAAARKTHRIPLYRNEIYERIQRGTFADVEDESWYGQPPSPVTTADRIRRDQRAGQNQPQTDDETPFSTLEQHVDLDLDQDGYAEPYIVTIEESSGCPLRLVSAVNRQEDIERKTNGKIICVHTAESFTKYSFIPSPDGGIYDMGFGMLLGPLNETVNSIVNQMVDAGAMRNTAGGFLGRGAKIRGGVYTFSPFQWQRVDSAGDDLRKNLVPLPTNEPSAVLFQLLGLLIEYTNRISGATDTTVGENPGQNTPAQNMDTMMEQGTKIYSAIFKRVWRGMKGEFKKLYHLNQMFLPTRRPFGTESGYILREDFLGPAVHVAPVADPNISSQKQEIMRAITLKQAAASTPGYDVQAVERRFLRALQVDAPDEVYKGFDPSQQQPPEKIQIEMLRLQGVQMKLQEERQRWVAELMEEQRVNSNNMMIAIAELQLKAREQEGDETDRAISALNAQIGLMKNKDEALRARIEMLMKPIELALADRKLDIEEKKVNKQGASGGKS